MERQSPREQDDGAPAGATDEILDRVAKRALRSEEVTQAGTPPSTAHTGGAPARRSRRALALVASVSASTLIAIAFVRAHPRPVRESVATSAAPSSTIGTAAPEIVASEPPKAAAESSNGHVREPPAVPTSSLVSARPPRSVRTGGGSRRVDTKACDPNYTVDDSGLKRFKPECF
jgi:hypothetical protein